MKACGEGDRNNCKHTESVLALYIGMLYANTLFNEPVVSLRLITQPITIQ